MIHTLFQTLIIKKQTKFPVKECTIPDPHETDTFHSDQWYRCFLINKVFPGDGISIKYLKPYIRKKKSGIRYGWTDHKQQYDHIDHPIHLDDFVVVRFIPVKE